MEQIKATCSKVDREKFKKTSEKDITRHVHEDGDGDGEYLNAEVGLFVNGGVFSGQCGGVKVGH